MIGSVKKEDLKIKKLSEKSCWQCGFTNEIFIILNHSSPLKIKRGERRRDVAYVKKKEFESIRIIYLCKHSRVAALV